MIKVCRVCLKSKKDDIKLTSIYEFGAKVAKNIFLLSGIKIMEFTNYHAPALICMSCLNELRRAISFRNKCIDSQNHFKEFLSGIEQRFWTDDQVDTKFLDNTIKEEPTELDFDFFGNVETNLEEVLEEEDQKFIPQTEENIIVKEFSTSGRRIKRPVKFEHSEDDEKELKNYCNMCCKTFTSKGSFHDHMRVIHQELKDSDMFACPYCDRLFKIKYYMNRHIRNTHKKIPVKNRKEPREKTLEDVFKEKPTGSNCPYCDRYLTSRHSLNHHIKVKHEFANATERYFCDLCGKDFSLRYYLLRHMKVSHLRTVVYNKKIPQSLPCSICGKIFKSKGNLSTHERTHRKLTADEYYYCDLCGNKFKSRGELGVHIRKRHIFKINYPCDLCPGRAWQTLFQLQRHVKVYHHNIREYKCEWCGKGFGDRGKLTCHTRIHTGEQPFQCTWENCDKKYTHQTDLRRHVWSHTGQRPYRCEVPNCSKGFMKKSELMTHEKRCHPKSSSQTKTTLMPTQYEYHLM